MNLYNKYRPADFDDMIGSKEVVEVLQKAFGREGSLPSQHVWLFTGGPGCGKTTAARICAQRLGVQPLSLKEVNSANNRGIDSAREIIEYTNAIPLDGKVFVFIIDEAHKTTPDFQNAMLKICEDTPEHIYIFFCTTNPEKLIAPLKTRCTTLEFQALQPKYLSIVMKRAAKGEGVEVDPQVFEEIADAADGSARMALQMLEKVMGLDKEKAIRLIRSGDVAVENATTLALCQSLLAKDSSWATIAESLKGLEDEPEKIRYAVLGYMNAILLKGKENPRAAAALESFSEPFYNSGKPGITLAAYQAYFGGN